MRYFAFALILIGVLILATPSIGVNYYWLTDTETSWSFPGDIIRFFGRDTLWGPIRTNGCFHFANTIVSIDTIYLSASEDECGSVTPGPRVVFDMPQIPFPDELIYLREASSQPRIDLYEEGQQWRCVIEGASARFYHWPEGIPFDTLSPPPFVPINLSPRIIVFVHGLLEIKGQINAQNCELIVGCSRDIRLIDDVMLEGTNRTTGELPENSTSRIAIASEQGIFIANTWENGRESCGGNYSNHGRCHIVITAYLATLGTVFQMEQMNDVGDNYISPVAPDERGNIVLTGGITQRYRGYVHRSNLNGTGYNKVYHWDERMEDWSIGVLEPFVNSSEYTDARETLFPSEFLFHVAPNPFNASTTIRFTLPTANHVRAIVYDVLGREILNLADAHYSAGNHQLNVNASDWATGLYFLQIEAGTNVSTHKLMLLR